MTITDRLRKVIGALTKNDLTETLTRIALFFIGIALLNTAFTNWYRFPIASDTFSLVIVLLTYVLGLTLIVLALLPWVRAAKLAVLCPLAAMGLVALNYAIFLRWVPQYGTDAIAFVHYSALLITGGENPYVHSMAPSLALFSMPSWFVTPLETGAIYDRSPYPALSFLIYVPAVSVGVSDIRPFSLGFHLMAIFVLFRGVEGPMRALGPVPLVWTQEMLDFTPGGITDILWLVPALLMAVSLRKPLIAGFWFGLACSIKQTPLILGPFLLIWYFKTGPSSPMLQRMRNPALFTLVSSLVFIGFNLPFLVSNAGAWVSAMAGPFAAPQVSFGSGLSGLAQFGHVALPRAYFTIVPIALFTIFLGLLYFRFDRFRYAFWMFPALILFFAYRSPQNFYVFFYPLAFFGLVAWFHASRKKA